MALNVPREYFFAKSSEIRYFLQMFSLFLLCLILGGLWGFKDIKETEEAKGGSKPLLGNSSALCFLPNRHLKIFLKKHQI